MATYAKVMPWGKYCRIFTQEEWIAGRWTDNTYYSNPPEDFVLERDCVDLREVIDEWPSSDNKGTMYLDGSSSTQKYWAINDTTGAVWGHTVYFTAPIYFCLLVGGTAPDSYAKKNVYVAFYNPDKAALQSSNQTSHRTLLSPVTQYESNPDYVPPSTNTSILRPDSLMMGWLTGSWIAGQRGKAG